MLIDHMTKYLEKMATTLQSKINELEARLRAENESRATDPMIRSLNSDKPNPRHPLPCMNSLYSSKQYAINGDDDFSLPVKQFALKKWTNM